MATKKISRVAAMLLALVMLLTLVPFQSFAAAPAATDLVLKDGVTVAISSDMKEDQVKQALFNALVSNPEGANWQDYEWEYYCEGKLNGGLTYDNPTWGSVNGFPSTKKIWGVTYHYTHAAIKDNEDDTWTVRLAGATQEVTITKVSSCTVNYNYGLAQGSVLVNDAQVSGTVTGVSPTAEIQFTVVPKEGYKVSSVTVNGEAVEAVNDVYTVLPVATTDIDVTFEEDGTFYNVTVNAGEGVTVKMNGLEVSGNVKVAEGVEYTFEYTPNESTSVKAVKLGEDDVTSGVSFANYVGTQKLTFTGDTTLAVESVAKSAQLVLTETTEVPVAINADGTFNYDGIRANLISALIDKAQSIGVDFTAENVVFEQYTKYYTSGDVPGVSSDWVPLEGKDGALGSYYKPVAAGSNHLRVAFTGNDQFRPTDYIEFDVTLVDVGNAVIAVKENPTVTLTETTVGNIDYSTLKQDIFDAAIDTASSLPAGLTLEDLELTVPENITESGKYSVTARYPGSVNYRETTVTFDVQVNVVKCPTADIALKADTVDAVLKETAVGVYDNAALKEAVYAAAVDLDACAANGLDVSKLVFELQDVKAEGTYTATVSYPETETMHGASKTVTVNVTVDKLPTVQFEQVEDSATLAIEYDRSYNYDGLKEEIFNKVLKVTGVEDLQWSDFTYEYAVADALGIPTYKPFETRKYAGDNDEILYNYLHKGGNFKIKVSIGNGTDYYGSEIIFNLNVTVSDSFVSEIVVNEGPFDLTLNMTRDRGYDYNALKQAIFDAAVVEVKNVAGEVNWDDLTYSYMVGLGKNFHEFEVDSVDGDLTSTYNYLREGGTFTVRLKIDDGNGYYASHVDITVNVTVADPFATDIKVNSEIAPVTLKETTVGNFDYESLKAQIFAAAIDAANSTPSDLTVDSFDFVIPKITASGTYNVTANFKETYENLAASVSFDVQINVEVLPTATIDLKANAVSVEVQETEVGTIDLETIRKAVFDGTVNAEGSYPALSYEDVTITFDKQITGDGKYIATIAYAGTSTIHGTSVKVTVDVDVIKLPTVKIETKTGDLVLNKTVDGGYDYDALKQAIFYNCLRISDVEGLTWDNFSYQYEISGAFGVKKFYDFDVTAIDGDLTSMYDYLYEGGTFKIKVSIPDSSTYHGAEAQLTINVTVENPYATQIVLKDNYSKDFTLNFKTDGSYDYDRLKEEIFNAVVDTEKSTPAGLTWESVEYAYDSLGGAGTEFNSFETRGVNLGDDNEVLRIYLHKSFGAEGNTKTIRLTLPASGDYNGTDVTFDVNVVPYSRVSSNVILKSGSIDYTNDVNAIKEYIFNNLIDFSNSKLPADVTIDDFTFEYYARYYTAGGVAGIDRYWVPIEGKDDVLDVYYKQIGNGTNTIRVVFNGTDDYLASTSNEASFTMSKASFSISLKQNYKYLDEALPNDFVQPSVNDNFQHYYFAVDASSDTATVYLDSLSGIKLTDITANVSFDTCLLSILGMGIVSADQVFRYDGLSREQLVTLLSDYRLVDYLSGYGIDENAVNAMAELVNTIPSNVKHFKFQAGQPTKPGTYTMFAMAANENYNTAFTSSVFYVKYHSTGTKLVFVQDTDGLNSINVKNFDYSAVVTKDGVPVQSDNVRYIYTGFRSNALFYASTKEGPRQAGIYTQTAWTLGGKYAFPKTRTFVVSIL